MKRRRNRQEPRAPGGERECEPVNSDLEADADQIVKIRSSDFAYDQLEYQVADGTISFDLANIGDVEHELAFSRAAGSYTLFCIVQTDDGETHYDKGMKSTLIVN